MCEENRGFPEIQYNRGEFVPRIEICMNSHKGSHAGN